MLPQTTPSLPTTFSKRRSRCARTSRWSWNNLAEQFATIRLQALLQVTMGQLAGLRPLQPAQHSLESITGAGEGRPDLVLIGVGGGGEYRVQGGASGGLA